MPNRGPTIRFAHSGMSEANSWGDDYRQFYCGVNFDRAENRVFGRKTLKIFADPIFKHSHQVSFNPFQQYLIHTVLVSVLCNQNVSLM